MRKRRVRIVECFIASPFTRFGEQTEYYLTTLTSTQVERRLEKEYGSEYNIDCHVEVSFTTDKLEEVLSGRKDMIRIKTESPPEY